jgi:hypothetical protein
MHSEMYSEKRCFFFLKLKDTIILDVLEDRQLSGDDSRTILFVTGQDPLLTSEKYVSNLQHGLKED